MTARPGNDPPAPYVGLRPFEFHEASLFYGRGEHIAEMVRTLRKGYFLAVVGSSGSGKSSLVRAGLLPAIAAGFMDAGEEAADWRFVIMRPGPARPMTAVPWPIAATPPSRLSICCLPPQLNVTRRCMSC